jgi:hypothetical protein
MRLRLFFFNSYWSLLASCSCSEVVPKAGLTVLLISLKNTFDLLKFDFPTLTHMEVSTVEIQLMLGINSLERMNRKNGAKAY